jgi:hypothetical protein
MPHSNVSPIDSSIFADGFSIADHHMLALKTETERVRAIRGEVLATVFEVEAKIDYAIGDLILPYKRTVRSPRWLRKRHLLLQNEILSQFQLRTKIDVLLSLLRLRFPKMVPGIAQLRSKLNIIRGVRNNMAHCPVYFEALRKKVSGRWLKPHLMTSHGTVHLSDGYVRAFKRDAAEARTLLDQVMKKGLKIQRPKIG